MKTFTFWYGIVDEDSDLCGEEFFLEVEAIDKRDARKRAGEKVKEYFPHENPKCYGTVTTAQAEFYGLDTY